MLGRRYALKLPGDRVYPDMRTLILRGAAGNGIFCKGAMDSPIKSASNGKILISV